MALYYLCLYLSCPGPINQYILNVQLATGHKRNFLYATGQSTLDIYSEQPFSAFLTWRNPFMSGKTPANKYCLYISRDNNVVVSVTIVLLTLVVIGENSPLTDS